MTRRANGPSRSCQVTPGHISLLTSSVASEWAWEEPIEVLHVYLETGLMSEVMGGFSIGNWPAPNFAICLTCTTNSSSASAISWSAKRRKEPGSRLFVELLANQLCIHLLRRYFDLKPSAMATIGEFEQAVVNRVRDHIMENLGEDLSLAALSRVARSVCPISGAVSSRLRRSSDRFVLNARLSKARRLLSDRRLAIAEVAAATGFADQSHLTRHFRNQFKVTPDQRRRG